MQMFTMRFLCVAQDKIQNSIDQKTAVHVTKMIAAESQCVRFPFAYAGCVCSVQLVWATIVVCVCLLGPLCFQVAIWYLCVICVVLVSRFHFCFLRRINIFLSIWIAPLLALPSQSVWHSAVYTPKYAPWRRGSHWSKWRG